MLELIATKGRSELKGEKISRAGRLIGAILTRCRRLWASSASLLAGVRSFHWEARRNSALVKKRGERFARLQKAWLHVLRFNCDEYVDAAGIRHGSLFGCTSHKRVRDADTQEEVTLLKVAPTARFAPAVEAVVARIMEVSGGSCSK